MEAGDASGTTTLDLASLRRLLRELADAEPTALYDPHRYALQVRLVGSQPAEALLVAIDRWRSAVRRLGLPEWPLCRAEVLTPDEFDRDQEASSRTGSPGSPRWGALPPPAATPADLLLHDAFHDSLTGLANRELFRERVRMALGEPAEPRSGATILVLDIDGFARVNQRLGHSRGDQVLAMVAARLLSALGSESIVARLGGDEFAILYEAPGREGSQMASIALSAVREELTVEGQHLSLTASAGLAVGDAGSDPDRLLRNAGTAMCAAKEAGGDRLLRFDPAIRPDVSRLDRQTDPVLDRLAYVILLQRAAVAANTCNDLFDAAPIVIAEVCAHAGWPIGRLYLPSADGERAEPTGCSVVSGLDRYRAFAEATSDRVLRRGHGLVGAVLATGSPACSNDLGQVLDDGDGDREALVALGEAASIRSALGFPVLVGDEVAGVLEFYSPWAEPPDGTLLEVMAGVGAQLGRVIERSDAQAALRHSEQRYRSLAVSASDAIVSVDDRGFIVSWNDAARATFGYSEAEALGQRLAILSPDHFGGPVDTLLDDLAVRAGTGGFMELTCRRHDGSSFPAESSMSAWEAGGRQYFTQIIRDVSGRREVENELRASEARFRALVENSTDAIVVLNRDGSVREHYEGVGFLGYEPGANSGRSGLEFVHPDDVGRAFETLMAFRDVAGTSPPHEFRIRHADGSWRRVEAVGNNLLDHPAVGGIVVTARDITDRGQAQQALEATQLRLKRISEAFDVTLVVVDADGTILLDVMRGTEAPVAASVGQLTHPDDTGAVEDLVRAAAANDAPVGPVRARIGGDGPCWHWAEWTAVNLLHDPLIEGVVVRAGKITEWADAQEHLNREPAAS